MEGVELISSDMNNQNPSPKVDGQSDSSNKQSVSFFSLFSAADKIDYVLMFVGSLGACIHGAALPVFFVLFGRMIDSLGHLSSNPHRLSSRISEVKCNYNCVRNFCSIGGLKFRQPYINLFMVVQMFFRTHISLFE